MKAFEEKNCQTRIKSKFKECGECEERQIQSARGSRNKKKTLAFNVHTVKEDPLGGFQNQLETSVSSQELTTQVQYGVNHNKPKLKLLQTQLICTNLDEYYYYSDEDEIDKSIQIILSQPPNPQQSFMEQNSYKESDRSRNSLKVQGLGNKNYKQSKNSKNNNTLKVQQNDDSENFD